MVSTDVSKCPSPPPDSGKGLGSVAWGFDSLGCLVSTDAAPGSDPSGLAADRGLGG